MALTPAQQAIVDSMNPRLTLPPAPNVMPWLSPGLTVPGSTANTGQMLPPTMAGGVAPTTVHTNPINTPIDRSGSMSYWPVSGTRSVTDLQAHVGSYGSGDDRLSPGPAGIGSGTGLTPQQVAALGDGWTVDPRTRALVPDAPGAAPQPAAMPPIPRQRPAYPVASMEDALIAAGIKPGVPMAQQGAGRRPTDPVGNGATLADLSKFKSSDPLLDWLKSQVPTGAGVPYFAGTTKSGHPAGWLQTSRQLAEVGFRQAAIQAANKKAAPPLPGIPALPPVPAGRRPSAPIQQPARGQSVAQFIQQQYGASPSVAYDKANEASALKAKMMQQAIQQSGMMTPVQQLQLRGMSASQAYDTANRNAQLAAIQRAQAAQANGQRTAVQNLQSQGNSAAQAYALANAQAAARAQASASSPSYSSSNSWFNSVTGR